MNGTMTIDVERPGPPEAEATRASRPGARIAILRSCRMPQFERAIRYVRDTHPSAEIVAISHRGHVDALRAAGVDRVLEIPGRRFTLSRTAPWTLVRLRRETYDEVVIPQMTHYEDVSRNLHRFSRIFRTEFVTLLPGDQPAMPFKAPPPPIDPAATLAQRVQRILS